MNDPKRPSERAVPLKEALQDHYAQATLPKARLHALLALQVQPHQSLTAEANEDTTEAKRGTIAIDEPTHNAHPLDGPTPQSATWLRHMPLFALFCMCIGAASWWFTTGPQNPRGGLVKAIAKEIAKNHRKYVPLARQHLRSNKHTDLDALRKKLTELPFRLLSPTKIIDNRWRLLKGKYCSIQGARAALLHYAATRKGNSAIHSLYQVKYPSHLALKGTMSVQQGNLRIRLWRQDDLLFGLASPLVQKQ